MRRIRPDEAELLRALRLRALTESPRAFGAALADEQDLPVADWIARAAAGAAGVDHVTFVAVDSSRSSFGPDAGSDAAPDPGPDAAPSSPSDGAAVGMAGGRIREPGLVGLSGMWVDPSIRGGPVAEALVDAVRDWAVSVGATRLRLGVVADAARAIHFYERLGFTRVGDDLYHLNRDPSIPWFEMARPL